MELFPLRLKPGTLIVGDIISIRIGSNEIATHTIASEEESGGLAKKAFTIEEEFTTVGTNSGQDGTYTLKAFIVDAKGNEREFTTSRDVLVDNVDPEITNADIISDDSNLHQEMVTQMERRIASIRPTNLEISTGLCG